MNRQPGAGARKDFAPEHFLLCDLDSQSSLGEEKLMWTEGEEASSLQSSSTVPLLLLLLLLRLLLLLLLLILAPPLQPELPAAVTPAHVGLRVQRLRSFCD